MKFLSLIYFLFALLLSTVIAKETCCEICPAGKEKYYSIDLKYNRCGECCMKSRDYWIFHIFEKGLKKAENEHPCSELGYNKYLETETHGALFIKMTLDKYDVSD